eukprot:PhF_6_TR19098/c0_g1_i1/m.28095
MDGLENYLLEASRFLDSPEPGSRSSSRANPKLDSEEDNHSETTISALKSVVLSQREAMVKLQSQMSNLREAARRKLQGTKAIFEKQVLHLSQELDKAYSTIHELQEEVTRQRNIVESLSIAIRRKSVVPSKPQTTDAFTTTTSSLKVVVEDVFAQTDAEYIQQPSRSVEQKLFPPLVCVCCENDVDVHVSDKISLFTSSALRVTSSWFRQGLMQLSFARDTNRASVIAETQHIEQLHRNRTKSILEKQKGHIIRSMAEAQVITPLRHKYFSRWVVHTTTLSKRRVQEEVYTLREAAAVQPLLTSSSTHDALRKANNAALLAVRIITSMRYQDVMWVAYLRWMLAAYKRLHRKAVAQVDVLELRFWSPEGTHSSTPIMRTNTRPSEPFEL